MSKNKFSVVVAVDFATPGQMALQHAVRWFAKPNVEIHVVHVATEVEVRQSAGGSELEKQAALLDTYPEKVWDEINAAVRAVEPDLTDVQLMQHVRIGDPVMAIRQLAADYDANIIIVGTAGKRGLERLVLGSVAEKLMREAKCPVLVMRANTLGDLPKSDRVERPRPDAAQGVDPDNDGAERHTYRPSHNWTRSKPTGFRIV